MCERAAMIAISILLLGLSSCHCANILMVFPSTSKSHHAFMRPLISGLVDRGHNVTVLAPIIEDLRDNYTGIKTPGPGICLETFGGAKKPIMFEKYNPFFHIFFSLMNNHQACITNRTLEATVASLKARTLNFDLVVTEFFFEQATAIFATYYKSPLVLVSTVPYPMKLRYLIGDSLELSATQHEYADVEDQYTFTSRFKNLYYIATDILYWKLVFLARHTEIAKHYFPEIPEGKMNLEAVIRNASLVMVNAPISIYPMHGTASNVVDISGIHIRDPEPISQELQDILDSSDGIILLSFGSLLSCNGIPPSLMKNLFDAFGNLKETVIWKCDADESQLRGKPKNVITRSWVPQQSILAHPKIKLFISHGGFLSVQEAVFYGVPVMGFPTFGDQYRNMYLLKRNGCGSIMSSSDVEGGRFKDVLHDMLNNKTYKYNAEILSKRFRSRPIDVLENAMFWLEYVIDNNGADFMKAPRSKMNWIQYEMIDIFVFIFSVAMLSIWMLLFSLKYIVSKLRKCYSNANLLSSKHKKKN